MPNQRDIFKNLKKIVKLNITFFKDNISYFDYYLTQVKLISCIKYYFFYKKQDYKNYVKVQDNIQLLQKYINNQEK